MICWNPGFVLIDDSDFGFDALRGIWRLPGNLQMEFLSIKSRETSSLEEGEIWINDRGLENRRYTAGDGDADIYGCLLRWLPMRRKIESYFINERDKSASSLNDNDDKYFWGLRLEEKMKEGIDYRVEFVTKQAGKKRVFKEVFSDRAIKYDGYAFNIGVVGYTNTALLGATTARIEYLQATGSYDEDDRGNFNPTYSRISNNYGERYFGEYYSELSHGIYNRKIIFRFLQKSF